MWQAYCLCWDGKYAVCASVQKMSEDSLRGHVVLGIDHLFEIRMTVSSSAALKSNNGLVQVDRCMRVQFREMVMIIGGGNNRELIHVTGP